MCNLSYKKKIIRVFLVMLLFYFGGIGYINAETIKVVDCEYTTQYKKWLKLSDKEKEKVTMPVKCKTSDNFFTSVGSNVNETYQSQKFDLRDYGYVTSVKDQGEAGLCWAFGTNASMESNLLMNNLGSYDFSEAHIGFAVQNKSFESLMPAGRIYSDGGNYLLSSAYIFNRMGPVLESDMSYDYILNALNGGTLPTVEELSSKNVVVSVDSTAMLSDNQGACTDDAITSIKKYLVSNGAIGAQMFFDYGKDMNIDSNYEIKSNTINGAYYYYDGSSYMSDSYSMVYSNSSPNHAVTIIGWDDTIDASKFSTSPSRNGAFIIKNSYGTNLTFEDAPEISIPMGENGYYYVSYDDINICSSLVGFYDISSEKEDNVYYHDIIGSDAAIEYYQDIYIAHVFEKKSSNAEKLEKISFLSYESNQQYDILVSLDGNLSNATVVKSGVTDRSGYITIDIDGIEISSPKYGIAIKYYHNANNTNGIFVYYDTDTEFYTMDVGLGKAYVSLDGVIWDDFIMSGTNVLGSIRAYTNNLDCTLTENSNSVVDNKFTVVYDYNNISDVENILYNIYKESDTQYNNSLNNNFEITNKLSSEKSIAIGLTDQSSEGDYVLLVQYRNIKIMTKFSVSLDENNELFFGKKQIEEETPDNEDDNKENTSNEENNNQPNDDENNSGEIEIEIEDNPLNGDYVDSETDSEEKDVTSNPKTGSKIMIAAIIIIISLGTAIAINIYNAKKNRIY